MRAPPSISLALAGCLLLVSTAAWTAQAPDAIPASVTTALPDGVRMGPHYAGISEYHLDNGLKVLLYPDASKPRTLVNVTYLVGSRHENYGETGMAHLLEHLLFKGTPEYRNLDTEFGKRGMQVNGTTSADRTNYYAVFEANPATLEWALGMEASRMTKSFIAKSDLDAEMTVVRNEMENGENDPFRVSYKNLLALAYQWHNYGNDTIGARADVEQVPIERLQAFYRTWYQPDNAVLLVAGSFDPATTLALVADRFGAIEKPARKLPHFYTIEPAQDGQRFAVVERIGGTPLLLSAYHVPAGGAPQSVAARVLARVLGDDTTGRLRGALVDGGLAAAAGAFSSDNHDSGQLMFYAQLGKDADVVKARRALHATIEGVGATPVTETEFSRARTQYRNELKSALDDVSRMGLALSEYIALGDWRLFFWEQQRLDTVTLAEVNAVATAYLKRSNRSTVQYKPVTAIDRVTLQPAPAVSTLIAELKAQEAVQSGETLAVDPASLETRLQRSTLRPGLKLVLLPKQTRNDSVHFGIRLHFGDAQRVAGKVDAAEALGELLLRGVGELDRVALADALAANEAELGADSGVTRLEIGGRTTRAHLAATLALAVQALKSPRLDAAEFESWRKEALADIDGSEQDPQARAGEALRELTDGYPAGHPLAFRSNATVRTALAALKVEDVRAFHQEFVDANTAEVVLVGDFDPEEVQSLLRTALGDWTRETPPYQRIPVRAGTLVGQRREVDTPDKAAAIFLAQQTLTLSDQDPDYPALLIGNHAFGGGQLENRLITRLRHKEGWSYGAGSALGAAPLEAVGQFQLYAQAAPENTRKLVAAVREELERLLKEGVRAEELKAAQDGWLKSRRVQWGSDARLVDLLLGQAEYDRTLAVSVALEQKVAALDVDTVNAALRKYLDPARLIAVIAGDLKKIGK